MTRHGRAATFACAAIGALLCGAPPGAEPLTTLPDGPPKALVEHACAQCHSLETVTRAHLTRRQWAARLDAMIAKGAALGDDDFDAVADYLAAHFGPVGTPPAASGAAVPAPDPAGRAAPDRSPAR